MAYTLYPAVAVSELWSASDNNTYNKDNINELWAYTTLGDLVYAANASTLSRLGIGSVGKVLTVVGGIPAWSTGAPGIFTSAGDLVYGAGDNSMAVLPKGTDKHQLVLSSGIPAWSTGAPGIFTAAGDLLYATASNVMTRLATATNGQFLQLKVGVPTWQTVALPAKLATHAFDNDTTSDVAVGATSVLNADDEEFDDGNWHDTVTNNSRITVPTGQFIVFANVWLRTVDNFYQSTGEIQIHVNGSVVVRKWFQYYQGMRINIEALYLDLSNTDYIEIALYHATNGNSNALGVSLESFFVMKVD